jgi:hypothetical protein
MRICNWQRFFRRKNIAFKSRDLCHCSRCAFRRPIRHSTVNRLPAWVTHFLHLDCYIWVVPSMEVESRTHCKSIYKHYNLLVSLRHELYLLGLRCNPHVIRAFQSFLTKPTTKHNLSSFRCTCSFYYFSHGVRLTPLGTSATLRSIVPALDDDDDDYGAVGGMRIGRGKRSTRENLPKINKHLSNQITETGLIWIWPRCIHNVQVKLDLISVRR